MVNRHFRASVTCPRCGAHDAHFVPPGMGDPGFFICDVATGARLRVIDQWQPERKPFTFDVKVPR